MVNIYGKCNHYKTKTERLSIITSLQKNLVKLLRKGYNPFKENQELYNKEIEKAPSTIVEIEEPKMTIKKAIDFALNLKKQSLAHTS